MQAIAHPIPHARVEQEVVNRGMEDTRWIVLVVRHRHGRLQLVQLSTDLPGRPRKQAGQVVDCQRVKEDDYRSREELLLGVVLMINSPEVLSGTSSMVSSDGHGCGISSSFKGLTQEYANIVLGTEHLQLDPKGLFLGHFLLDVPDEQGKDLAQQEFVFAFVQCR
ncbi:hypothetical protein FIBSPDRAFT_886387 [Athelia psychrophila]|uniref:Uncharacterized protein n=1 Tax=Athelia psychrophila TaxID=1759441 RepID=A0A166QS95_9AGAM|nr:hypothetical protein FIBSPDRAFT_886387 [Fibularhizoctonia sp. CBS 109695]